ncbi:MAG: ribonuclease III family protein, partial [Oceanobacter sp.]
LPMAFLGLVGSRARVPPDQPARRDRGWSDHRRRSHRGSGQSGRPWRSGGHRRESILADTVEALIGAIYLDAGFEAARDRILSWYGERLDGLSLEDPIKDPKTRLQEYQQAHQLGLPKYKVLSVEGPTNEQVFNVECRILGLEPAVSVGTSRRGAEQAAAQKLLTLLGLNDFENEEGA